MKNSEDDEYAGGARWWPANPRRIARTVKHQRTTRPASWVATGFGRAWAWDTDRGLIELDASPGTIAAFDQLALSPDGRRLAYNSQGGWNKYSHVYDIPSGERTDNPLIATRRPRVIYGPGDIWLTATWLGKVPGERAPYRYELHDHDQVRVLDSDAPLGGDLVGPKAYFSFAGDDLAMGHTIWDPRRIWMSITNLRSGHVTRYDGIAPTTYGAWSPSGHRLLVRTVEDTASWNLRVLDRRDGSVRSIEPLILPHGLPAEPMPSIGGWVDDHHVFVQEARGRRLMSSLLNVDTGARHDLVDLPLPREVDTLHYAPFAAQRDPASLGYYGP